jgi:DNA-binding GntR family transcriptional regulator
LAPQVHRPDPPYMQVVKHIRGRIESGELRDGDVIPSARQLTKDWNISLATATKALATLRAEGLVKGVQGIGTTVTTSRTGHTATDRAKATHSTGRIYTPDEHAKIRDAALATASEQVADALGIKVGAPVIQRHRVTYRGDIPVSASISWFDGALAAAAPRLLETGRILQGTFGYIAETTGRTVKTVRDQNTADAANERDSQDLGVPVGSPVLRGRNWVYDADGNVIEYGEHVSAAGRWKSYEYEIN